MRLSVSHLLVLSCLLFIPNRPAATPSPSPSAGIQGTQAEPFVTHAPHTPENLARFTVSESITEDDTLLVAVGRGGTLLFYGESHSGESGNRAITWTGLPAPNRSLHTIVPPLVTLDSHVGQWEGRSYIFELPGTLETGHGRFGHTPRILWSATGERNQWVVGGSVTTMKSAVDTLTSVEVWILSNHPGIFAEIDQDAQPGAPLLILTLATEGQSYPSVGGVANAPGGDSAPPRGL